MDNGSIAQVLGEIADLLEIKGENGDEVTPPPPEVIEPDPALSPEEAEQVRKTIC